MIQLWAMNLLCACIQGALLIVTVWGICRCFPRLSPATRCALWWLSCAKLVIGLFWLTPITLPILPAVTMAENTLPAVSDPASTGATWFGQFSPLTIIFGLWLVGVGIVLMLLIRQMICVHHVIQRSSPITNREIIEEAERLASQIGLQTAPRLLTSELAPGPLAVGALHPAVLLPPTDLKQLSRTELRSVLAHEFAHIRRQDLWFGILPLLARTLFFFHPLVWLACNEYEQAQEAACDAEAIRASGVRRDDYGRLLLKLGTINTSSYRSLALGVKADYRWMLRRLQNLEVVYPMSTSRISLSLIATVGLAALSLVPVRVTAKPTVIKKPAAVSTPTAKNIHTSFTMTAPAVTVKPAQGTTNRQLKEVRLRLTSVKAEKAGKAVPSSINLAIVSAESVKAVKGVPSSISLAKIVSDKATVNGSVIVFRRVNADTFITTDDKNRKNIKFKLMPTAPSKTNLKATVFVESVPAVQAIPATPAIPTTPAQKPLK